MTRAFVLVHGTLILSAVSPSIGAIVCAVLLALQIAMMAIRAALAGWPPSAAPSPGAARNTGGQPIGASAARDASKAFVTPHFSIHVATHREPPHLVIRTLQSLLDQEWPGDGYEIIVIDNNTADPRLWRPVQTFCDAHPTRIKFLHRMGVQGAKAGALNIALDHTDAAATHVITVDADYVVHRDFLKQATDALRRTGADFVQFPQSYVATDIAAAGVDAELEEYFRTNASAAGDAEAVLLTGTLSVISAPALVSVGGWSGATTTEDAELGVRLCRAGFAGHFIDRVVGKGLLPLSLRDLEEQRYRWCSGNVQTLLRHGRSLLMPGGHFDLRKRVVILSQLTAWVSFLLIPFALLTIWLLTGQGDTPAARLAAGVIVLGVCDTVIRVLVGGVRDRQSGPVGLQALACRIALAPKSAKATFDALTGRRLTFRVTDKSGTRGPTRGLKRGPAAAAAALPACHLAVFLTSGLLLTAVPPSDPLILAALSALLLPLPAAVFTDLRLRTYRAAVSIPPKKVSI